jgi:hypothetical protein
MNNPLKSLHVKRFKGIKDAPFDASPMNVFIGANNSGKSSLAQIIHFAVGILQSIELEGRWGRENTVSLSLSPNQLLYSPCVDLYSLGTGGRLLEEAATAIEVSFVLNDGKTVTIMVRKGRNGNIHVTVSDVSVAQELSNLETPYTIYSPGLAGLARHETYISNGVLLRTIARGDANLVFRNILCRLNAPDLKDEWNSFMEDLQKLFPGIGISVDYAPNTDEFLNILVNSGGGRVPIELAGTGVLQAVQILSYVHYFHPSVIILDEPDSHLHPNNQRLLCKLLQSVAEERDTQVFLTTHSRHVVDALSGQATFLWVRAGSVEKIEQDYDLAVLLDIGALDAREMLAQPSKCIVLTEDAIKRGLEVLLAASGFPMSETLVLAYHGCTTPNNLRPLIELIRSARPSANILVHRDRDYLTDTEQREWETEILKMGVEPFLTTGVDVESHFLNAKHIAQVNGITEESVVTLLKTATDNTREESIKKFINSRIDIEKKNGTFGKLNVGELATRVPGLYDANPARYRYSKGVLKELRRLFQDANGNNLKLHDSTVHLSDTRLNAVVRKLPK